MKHFIYIVVLCLTVNVFLTSGVRAENFNYSSSAGGSAERYPDKKMSKGCSLYTCGPTSIIKLSPVLLATSIDKHNYNIGQSSTFEQMMNKGEGAANLNPNEMMMKMGVTPQSAEKSTEIEIVIPLIDYGFSGSFSNILIKVSTRNEAYKSVEQGLTNKDSKYEFTGSVTIEKYSPYVLKGSYTAPLKRYEAISARDIKCPAFSDPSTPPCTITKQVGTGNVNGQFNILSPWRNDSRLNNSIDRKVSFVDPFAKDIGAKATEFGIDVDVDEEFAKAGLGSSGSSARSGPSSASVAKEPYGGCNCSCNFVNTATAQCKTACSATFSACNGERHTPPESTTVNRDVAGSLFPTTSSNQALTKIKGAKLQGIDQDFVDNLEKGSIKTPENLREQFISLLEKNHPGEKNAPIRDMMVKGFDSMPDDNSKMIMLQSVRGN